MANLDDDSSLPSDLREILENASRFSMAETRRISDEWLRRLAGRDFADSTELIREDRER